MIEDGKRVLKQQMSASKDSVIKLCTSNVAIFNKADLFLIHCTLAVASREQLDDMFPILIVYIRHRGGAIPLAGELPPAVHRYERQMQDKAWLSKYVHHIVMVCSLFQHLILHQTEMGMYVNANGGAWGNQDADRGNTYRGMRRGGGCSCCVQETAPKKRYTRHQGGLLGLIPFTQVSTLLGGSVIGLFYTVKVTENINSMVIYIMIIALSAMIYKYCSDRMKMKFSLQMMEAQMELARTMNMVGRAPGTVIGHATGVGEMLALPPSRPVTAVKATVRPVITSITNINPMTEDPFKVYGDPLSHPLDRMDQDFLKKITEVSVSSQKTWVTDIVNSAGKPTKAEIDPKFFWTKNG